ncbi:uncharacterized protein LOC127265757 isoform X2 [Andrographis paniculata]|nr:uncharacterized protein LOC127265757 isoform X2 [Andrographis paniculata]
MEHGSNSMDMAASEMHGKRNHVSHNIYESTEQREPLYSNPEFTMVPNNGMGHDNPSSGSMGLSSIWMPDQLTCEDSSIPNNMSGGNLPLPVKRKADVGPLPQSSVPQQSHLPNKKPGNIQTDANSLGVLQPQAPQKTTLSVQSKFGPSPPSQPSPNKKMMRNDSVSGKSGVPRGPAKKQTGALESTSTSKGRSESMEGVRSKMRESLAGALAMACNNQDNVSDTAKNKSDAAQVSESNSTFGIHVPASSLNEVYPLKDTISPGKTGREQIFPTELSPCGSSGINGPSFPEFQYSSGLPDEDGPFGDDFFVKDDLLQGHGLSWAFDFDVQMGGGEDEQNEKNLLSTKEEGLEHGVEDAMTPEYLAFQIEAELFKLFGDVNKKYREKGRSLLFNLKDRNNPELRARVMSGEISPERLCSMSAEELASKELSEWRMAKAEELAQMVVLPDTEVDIRRLVRKTHKGEFQVEVEHGDDGIGADVSGGASMSMQSQPQKESEALSPSEGSLKEKERLAGQESHSEDPNLTGSVIIPTTGTDLMQETMVDELKDAEFLPPIVSLDEFMESLHTEPPFDALKHAGQKTPTPSLEESSKLLSNSQVVDHASNSPKNVSSRKVSGNVKKREVSATSPSGKKLKHLPSDIPKVGYIWDGVLKLNTLTTIAVGGIFQSGEKTSTKEWPSTLEVKGRVRLEAFEKFLQELPMSRTRAVMVLQFVLKHQHQSNNERSNLSEVIEAYSSDQRLGYAEPSRGIELYLCPPTSRITEILDKQMHKSSPKTDGSMEKIYLIGVVVWRRAHTSSKTKSPHSPSHHKQSSKKHPTTMKRVQELSNTDSNTVSRTSPPVANKPQQQKVEKLREEAEDDDDDDIPPGFGPGVATQATKDDDDLPEYNFSGEVNPSIPRTSPHNLHPSAKINHRPVDQVRELIKKYGQGSSLVDDRNLGFEPWIDDDDDDIPEWRPPGAEASQQSHSQRIPADHGSAHRLQVPARPTNRQMAAMAAQKSPSVPPGAPPRWVQPPGPPIRGGSRWRQP